MRSGQTRTYQCATSTVFLKTNEAFGGLSNMAGGFPLHVNGVHILTSEALYQACRFPHLPDVQRLIIEQRSPMTAKMKSKPHRKNSRADWDQVRVKIMRWCLRVKLAQNWRKFSELLLETGDRPVVEQSHKDDFWGAKPIDDDTLVGMNVLGRLLMELREAVKTECREMLCFVQPLAIPDFLLYGEPIVVVATRVTEIAREKTQTSMQAPLGYVDGPTTVQPLLFDEQVVRESAPPANSGVKERSVRIADFKPYSEYRELGVQWLGQVPAHWEVLPLTAVASPKSIIDQQHRELLSVYLDRGVIRFSEVDEKRTNVTSQDLSKYQAVDPGDFVLNNQQAWRGSVGVSSHSGIVSPAYLVLSLSSRLNSHFANLLFRERVMVDQYLICSRGVGSIQRNLYWPHLKRVSLLLPPFPEQTAIARFLDHVTNRIERYIRAKKNLIALLEEQKQVMIHDAVTGRADVRTGQPYPAYKDSGVEWLGKVPAHWGTQRLRNIARIYFSNVDKLSKDNEFSVRLCNYSDVYHNDRIHFDMDFMKATATAEEVVRFRLRVGDVLITKDSEAWDDIGVPAIVESAGHDLVCGYHLALLRPIVERANGKFLHRALLCRSVANQFFVRAYGVTRFGLSQPAIKSVWLPIAPLPEQIAIVRYLDKTSSKIDKAITQAQREIELLHEYHTRLVADVVTGKLDVREAAAQLPDEAPLELVEDDTGLADEFETADEMVAL